MTEDDRLFEESLRKTTDKYSGQALDTALAEFGWREALADDRHLAVSTLFRLQGEANVTSTALDDVLLTALSMAAADDTAVVLPRIGRVDAPGSGSPERIAVHGVATRRIKNCDNVVVVTADGNDTIAFVIARDALTLQAIDGIDPELRLVAVDASNVAPRDG